MGKAEEVINFSDEEDCPEVCKILSNLHGTRSYDNFVLGRGGHIILIHLIFVVADV